MESTAQLIKRSNSTQQTRVMLDITEPENPVVINDNARYEYHVTIHGWKNNPSNTFASGSVAINGYEYMLKTVADQRARIGEQVDAWQPHITKVTVKRRIITDWKDTDI